MIILYLKKCLCGCEKLYFGKTTKNINNYSGSGLHWLRHLKKHNKGHENIFIHYFKNEEICSWFAEQYSLINDIVNSDKYFNLIYENGLDGGDTFSMKSEKEKSIIRKKLSKKGENHPMYNKKHSEESRKKISESKKGKKRSQETRQKISEKALNRERNHKCYFCNSIKMDKSNFIQYHSNGKCLFK